MNHELSLEVIDTLNQSILRLVDTSIYNSNLDITCSRLDILVPGFTNAVSIDVDPLFNSVITACDLNLQRTDCDSKHDYLPDGVYAIRYSVSPNDKVYVEYNHLRTACIMNKYKSVFCSLDLCGNVPEKETHDKLKLLMEIKSYIEAAKIKVEICHEPQKGMELYNYANKLLSKFACGSCY